MLTVYSSIYGHIRRMTEAMKEGVDVVIGADVRICHVLENLPEAENNHCFWDQREGKQFTEGEWI